MSRISVSVATAADREEALVFLEKQGLLENAWLAWNVGNWLRKMPESCHVLICRLEGAIVGVASVSRMDYPNPRFDHSVSLDALDGQALAALIEAVPNGQIRYSVFRPFVQEQCHALPGAECGIREFHYTTSRNCFKRVSGDEIRVITPADDSLFDGEEMWPPKWEYALPGDQVIAILRDGRVASVVTIQQLGPRSLTGRRIVCFGGLETHSQFRRRGLARRLVSHATERILDDGDVPMYWTEPENIASQNLCCSLGYWQYAQEMVCLWRKSTMSVLGAQSP